MTNVIVGLGNSGFSCARYFKRHGIAFAVMDANPAPARLAELRALAPEADFFAMDEAQLLQADRIVLSPGVSREIPEVRHAIDAGVPVTGDVALFGELADAPIAAITGSNGKSTVTALVGEMAKAAGMDVGVGGNIGIPCLDLLEQGHGLYVIEVSSFQLETATRLPCEVAVVLNLSPDHMDRYPNVDAYYQTKACIYRAARHAVINRDLDYDFDLSAAESVISFGSGEPTGDADFGIRSANGVTSLARGVENLMSVDEMTIKGSHNHQNALAALAIGTTLGVDMAAMLATLKTFKGLPHRCEWVAEKGGVEYINDSKATNVGSTIAAVEGLGSDARNIVLIMGGIGKDADFSLLQAPLARYVKRVYLFGRDREVISAQLPSVEKEIFETLEQVVQALARTVEPGDRVLFAPACASQDQFRNFEHRGDVFKALVLEQAS